MSLSKVSRFLNFENGRSSMTHYDSLIKIMEYAICYWYYIHFTVLSWPVLLFSLLHYDRSKFSPGQVGRDGQLRFSDTAFASTWNPLFSFLSCLKGLFLSRAPHPRIRMKFQHIPVSYHHPGGSEVVKNEALRNITTLVMCHTFSQWIPSPNANFWNGKVGIIKK